MKLSNEHKEMIQVIKNTVLNGEAILLMLLGLVLFVTALTVVCIKDSYREHYIALQQEYSSHDQLETEWGQLLLEESTWAAHSHVEDVAQTRLAMVAPTGKQIQLIYLPKTFSTNTSHS
jgi:cell division protein FtsL